MGFDFSKIKEFDAKTITEKMRSGEIELPEKGSGDREALMDFIKLPVEGSEREEFIASRQGTTEVSAFADGDKDDGSDVPESPEPEPVAGTEDKKDEAIPEESKKSLVDVLGYSSEEEAVKSLNSLRALVGDQEATLRSYNIKEAERGRRLKELEESVGLYKKQISELEGKVSESGKKTRPTRPKAPKVTDFEDKDDFDTAFTKYVTEELPVYEESLSQYEDNISGKLSDLEKRLNELQPTVEKTRSYVETSAIDAENSRVNREWDGLWNEAVPEIQKKYGLDTSVSVKTISDAYTTKNNPEASPDEKTRAISLLNSLTEKDRKSYEKVYTAINAVYSFEEDKKTKRVLPRKMYRTVHGALVDKNVIDQYTIPDNRGLTVEEEKALRDKQLALEKKTVSPVPAHMSAAGENSFSVPENEGDREKRLMELLKMYAAASKKGVAYDRAFQKTKEYREYLELRKATGRKLTASQSRLLQT